jgi:hypothetical protein
LYPVILLKMFDISMSFLVKSYGILSIELYHTKLGIIQRLPVCIPFISFSCLIAMAKVQTL